MRAAGAPAHRVGYHLGMSRARAKDADEPDPTAYNGEKDMPKLHGLGLALALLSLSAAATAADDTVGKWYVAPLIYGVRTGNDRNVADDTAISAAVGKNLSSAWSVEAAFSHGHFGAESQSDALDINALSVDFLRHFYRDAAIHPYVTFGVVDSNESRPSIGSYDRAMIQAGLGLLARIATKADVGILELRLEAKGRWHESWLTDPHQGTPADFLLGLGVQFNFGATAAGPSQVKELVVPPPAAEPAAAPAPPKDSDGDGVTDDLDRCPNTPAGVKVDASGCPLDSDHDGVPDYLDKCPGTPAGIKVDANGCEIEEIVLKGVNFDFNSAKLTHASEAVLDEVVTLLTLRRGAPAILGGHTDGKGKHEYNMKLSERRAAAVRDYLVAKGIPAASLTAKGYGETKPIAPNTTDEGRAQNRRVTLEFARLVAR